MQDNTSGRRWARATLTGSLLASIVGNVAHTVLADSSITLALRVPAAVIWPLATFFAIEVLVRMIWQPRTSHRLARFMLIMPAIPAAITSYEHLHALLLLMGENTFIAWIGPAAIDGLMIGCTMTLLFTRSAPAEILPEPVAEMTELESPELPEAPVSPAPVSTSPATPRVPRGQITPALSAAVEALIDGAKPEEGPGASRAVIARYAKTLRVLRNDPHAAIDFTAQKVRPELVETMRRAATLA